MLILHPLSLRRIMIKENKLFIVIALTWAFACLPFAEDYEENYLECGAACFIFSWWLFLTPIWVYGALIFLEKDRAFWAWLKKVAGKLIDGFTHIFYVVLMIVAAAAISVLSQRLVQNENPPTNPVIKKETIDPHIEKPPQTGQSYDEWWLENYGQHIK